MTLVGDLSYQRSTNSLAFLLAQFSGVKVTLVSPQLLRVRPEVRQYLVDNGVEVSDTRDLRTVASELDVVYVGEGQPFPDVGATVVKFVADGVLERVLDTVTPQPIAAVAALPSWSLASVFAGDGLVLVGDRIGDPGNVGTIIRSLEAFGGAGLVLTAGSADPFQPKDWVLWVKRK